nr:hypothetical protein [Tanacetum cinerariifolium]
MEWSEMLREILDLVAQKYVTFYEDYPSFAGVCKSWRLAAVHNARTCHNSNGPPSRFPSLMLAEKSEDKEFRELFLLSNKSIRKIRLPEAYGKLCMSSCGWLLTVGDDHASQLINPLSRETVNLPKVNTFSEFSDFRMGYRHHGQIYDITYYNGRVYSFSGQIYDITYYNGRVYSFDCKNNIRACDVDGEDPTIMVQVSRLPIDEVFGAYILGLDDSEGKRLLVVIREGLLDNIGDESCVETYKTKSFQIFQYDLENGKWSKVQDLGIKTVFVGYCSSFWMEDTTGVIKSNCIYYTDDVLELYGGSQKGGGRDMGIYHLSDGTIEPHFNGESRSLFTPPIWLQSV